MSWAAGTGGSAVGSGASSEGSAGGGGGQEKGKEAEPGADSGADGEEPDAATGGSGATAPSNASHPHSHSHSHSHQHHGKKGGLTRAHRLSLQERRRLSRLASEAIGSDSGGSGGNASGSGSGGAGAGAGHGSGGSGSGPKPAFEADPNAWGLIKPSNLPFLDAALSVPTRFLNPLSPYTAPKSPGIVDTLLYRVANRANPLESPSSAKESTNHDDLPFARLPHIVGPRATLTDFTRSTGRREVIDEIDYIFLLSSPAVRDTTHPSIRFPSKPGRFPSPSASELQTEPDAEATLLFLPFSDGNNDDGRGEAGETPFHAHRASTAPVPASARAEEQEQEQPQERAHLRSWSPLSPSRSQSQSHSEASGTGGMKKKNPETCAGLTAGSSTLLDPHARSMPISERTKRALAAGQAAANAAAEQDSHSSSYGGGKSKSTSSGDDEEASKSDASSAWAVRESSGEVVSTDTDPVFHGPHYEIAVTANVKGEPKHVRNSYSSSGFDILGALTKVAMRKNPRIQLGPIDLSCALTVSDALAPDHPPIYFSDMFRRLTGYQPADVLGKNCRFLQAPDGNVAKGSERLYTDGQAAKLMRKHMDRMRECQASLINYKKNGKAFISLVTIVPIPWGDSNVIQYVVGFQVDLVEQPGAILEKDANGQYVVNYTTAGRRAR
ncbi:hypothetical protein OC842_007782 [Tilletia horrida]|uniref:PAS domain-containing protein n=1 Tax=Tilletia horrida TaxID=155126 RepID=A0AAN6G391_9BASI|nr:hypothetical protein OC842_007782 [Tilletia horrida]